MKDLSGARKRCHDRFVFEVLRSSEGPGSAEEKKRLHAYDIGPALIDDLWVEFDKAVVTRRILQPSK